MIANAFVDCNVLLYAISNDPNDHVKTNRANQLLRRQDLGISVQVLGEFYRSSRHHRKSFKLTHEQACQFIDIWKEFVVLPLSQSTVDLALTFVQRYQLTYWDALIAAAANELGCRTLFSEDMNHGQLYGTVRVLNPFDPSTALES